MSATVRRYLTIDQAKAEGLLGHGDALLYRPSGVVGTAIAVVSRGEHSHFAILDMNDPEWPWVYEVRECRGGRGTPLARQVEWFPRLIDVYTLDPDNHYLDHDRERAVRFMRSLAGAPYDYRGVLRAWTTHFWVVRLLVRLFPCWGRNIRQAEKRLGGHTSRMFCSMAGDVAYHLYYGVDPVPGVDSRLTEPSDFARSRLFAYACTLIPEEQRNA